MGSTGGIQGQFSGFEGPRPFGSQNNAKKSGKKFLAYFGQKGVRKISGLGPKKKWTKIGQNGPSRVLGAIFGPSGTISDPTGRKDGVRKQ